MTTSILKSQLKTLETRRVEIAQKVKYEIWASRFGHQMTKFAVYSEDGEEKWS